MSIFTVENLILFKTYPAREKYDYEGSSEKLYNSLICSNKKYFDDSIEMFEYINKKTHPNDVIIVLGAGDIYNIFKNKVN